MAEDPHQPSVPLAEIAHGPSAFEQFLDRNQKYLLIVLILAILGVVAFVIYKGVEDGKQLSAAHAFYDAEDADSLKKVIAEHAGTPAASSAMLKLSEQLWEGAKKDESIATLRSFLSQTSNHPGRPAAKASLAAKLMAGGNAAEATSAFEEILDDPDSAYLAPFALMSLGDMAAAAGDQEKAKNYYEQAKSEYPTSGFNQRISQRIAGLNATPPTEVNPPVPEPTTAEELPTRPTPLIPESQLPAVEESSAPDATHDATDSPSGNPADQNKSTEP